MINIRELADCCGCNACGDVCATGAISYERDVAGFLYPKVDQKKCRECGACERVCPTLHSDLLHKRAENNATDVYAAVSRNLPERFESTSGGVFSLLANEVLRSGGFVGGAVWDSEFRVKQVLINDMRELPKLRASKYAQSNAVGFYHAVKEAVKCGALVLVCGTPCQMSALRLFLGKEYDNLIIVDFICRSTASPNVMQQYVDYIGKKYGSRVVSLQQKNKELGWRSLTTKFKLENGRIVYDRGSSSLFMEGFVRKNLFARESCYDCKFKGVPRLADISLGDCWGVVDQLPKDMDGDLGTSLVICNTQKGKDFFRRVRTSSPIDVEEIADTDLRTKNPAIYEPLPRPVADRGKFFEALGRHQSFDVAISSVLNSRVSLYRRIRASLGMVKAAILRLVRMRRNVWTAIRVTGIKPLVLGRGYLNLVGNVVWQQDARSTFKVKKVLNFGMSLFRCSSLESRLLMMRGAKFLVEEGRIFYGANVEIFEGGILEIGKSFHANINCTISCGCHIKIGDDVSLGRDVSIRDTHGHIVGTEGFEEKKPIEIGDHVWIASGAMIFPGVKIGSGAIVGARSLVTKDVPAGCMVVGSPARVVRENIQFKM